MMEDSGLNGSKQTSIFLWSCPQLMIILRVTRGGTKIYLLVCNVNFPHINVYDGLECTTENGYCFIENCRLL